MAQWLMVFCVNLCVILVSANYDVAFPESARVLSSNADQRIISGWLAEDGQIPYIMRMRSVTSSGGINSCGATIIHQEWGLTAAHCTATRISFVLYAGGVNITRPEIMFETREYYTHPDFDIDTWTRVQQHDISLIKFGKSLVFSDRVQPVRLQPSIDKDRNYEGMRLIASGWGYTFTYRNYTITVVARRPTSPSNAFATMRLTTAATIPERLNWVYLEGVSNIGCWFAYGGANTNIHDTTVCAGPYNISWQGVCQGDSGGPLVLEDEDGQPTQIGVTSFTSSRGCHVRIPGGFIRPGHYLDWFREVTGVQFDWNRENIQ